MYYTNIPQWETAIHGSTGFRNSLLQQDQNIQSNQCLYLGLGIASHRDGAEINK